MLAMQGGVRNRSTDKSLSVATPRRLGDPVCIGPSLDQAVGYVDPDGMERREAGDDHLFESGWKKLYSTRGVAPCSPATPPRPGCPTTVS